MNMLATPCIVRPVRKQTSTIVLASELTTGRPFEPFQARHVRSSLNGISTRYCKMSAAWPRCSQLSKPARAKCGVPEMWLRHLYSMIAFPLSSTGRPVLLPFQSRQLPNCITFSSESQTNIGGNIPDDILLFLADGGDLDHVD